MSIFVKNIRFKILRLTWQNQIPAQIKTKTNNFERKKGQTKLKIAKAKLKKAKTRKKSLILSLCPLQDTGN